MIMEYHFFTMRTVTQMLARLTLEVSPTLDKQASIQVALAHCLCLPRQ